MNGQARSNPPRSVMGTASWWRATSAALVALLSVSVIVGFAAAPPAAGQVSGSAAAAGARSPGAQVPTVDGVRRFNVGAAHSPALLRRLSGPLGRTGRAAAPSALSGVDVADAQHLNGAAINWTQVASAGYGFAFIAAMGSILPRWSPGSPHSTARCSG